MIYYFSTPYEVTGQEMVDISADTEDEARIKLVNYVRNLFETDDVTQKDLFDTDKYGMWEGPFSGKDALTAAKTMLEDRGKIPLGEMSDEEILRRLNK